MQVMIESGIKDLPEDAKNVSDWSTQHASGLNVSKTSAIIFGVPPISVIFLY